MLLTKPIQSNCTALLAGMEADTARFRRRAVECPENLSLWTKLFTVSQIMTALGAFASYDTAKYLLRAEFGNAFESGFIHHSGAYVEAGYKIDRHWQPVFRYEWAREGLVTPVAIPDSFKSHRDIGGGLDYWVNPKAVLKFSYHHVDGNMLSVPRGDLDLASLFAAPKTTDMATFGLAFVF